MNDRWPRSSTQRPCPVCGHGDYCLFSPDGRAVICPRIKGGLGWRGKNNCGGYFHWIDKRGPVIAAPMRPNVVLHSGELTMIARRCKTTVVPKKLDRLSSKLGLSVRALKSMGIGWANGEPMVNSKGKVVSIFAWTFPMSDLIGGTWGVVGIRFRTDDGAKFSMTGGSEGLFVPEEPPRHGAPLAMPEGPTSTAAMIDLGFDAIGRPNNLSGVDQVRRMLLARNPKVDLGVIGDRDPKAWVSFIRPWKKYRAGVRAPVPVNEVEELIERRIARRDRRGMEDPWPGRDGAISLARNVMDLCESVNVAIPPAKDMRDWLIAGATTADVAKSIGKPFEQFYTNLVSR